MCNTMKNKRVLYEFDRFRVDSGQFLLVNQGQSQPITPTVFRILLLLLENAGQIVTKDELISNVWSDSFVEEGNLNRNVSTLRKVLGEAPRDHRYIETIPKTGYRFVASVRQVEYQPPTGNLAQMPVAGNPIAGRRLELFALHSAFAAMKEGQGGAICLSGEVGMGKSALVDTFLADIARDGERFHLASARCSESRTEPEPFGPFFECLTALMGIEATAEAIRTHAPTWYREMTQAADDKPVAAAAVGRMKREMVELLNQMAAIHPVVLVVDDFHWADIASIDLLSFLAVRLPHMRVLMIVCVRPDELRINKSSLLQTCAQLAGSGLIRDLSLSPLSREEVEEYVNDRSVASMVHARSEGNPLFMVEVARSFSQDASAAKRQDAVPDSLRNLIRSRLDRLSDTDRSLLSAASVQGFEFDSAILAKSLASKPEEIEARLQAIYEVHGLIRRLREEQLMDGLFTVRYSFAHDLYRVVCHESLPPTRKASLNSAVAEAFLAFYGA